VALAPTDESELMLQFAPVPERCIIPSRLWSLKGTTGRPLGTLSFTDGRSEADYFESSL
jgi:hypothetical protein